MHSRKKRRFHIFHIILVITFFVAALTGCKLEKTEEKKIEDLEYTICNERKIPMALLDIIEEKKAEPFKLTYRTKEHLYIVVGYGAQDRRDLGVSVSELYRTKNAIFVDTDLVSYETTTIENGTVSYPWIAIKCKWYEEPVNFR